MSSSLVFRIAVLAVLVTFLVVNGCATPAVRPGHVALKQAGQVTLAAGEEKDVPFRTAYGETPDVQLAADPLMNVKVVKCQGDHFRIRNDSYEVQTVSWTVTGEQPTPAK